MKNLVYLFLTMSFIFTSCGSDSDELGDLIGGKKGVHKIEVTVTATSDNVTTVMVFSGIGKDGLNANASLYDESGKKCADGTDTRTIKNGIGKFACYTASDATGILGSMSVVCHDEATTATMLSIAYINDKEVSRIEKTFSTKQGGQINISSTSKQ